MSTRNNDDNLFQRIIQGRLVSGTFFARHWLTIFVVLSMVLIYITNRYSCQRSMDEIRRLNERLAIVQSESYRVRGQYMSRIRESEMREMLDTLGLNLAVQSRPPYHISNNSKKNNK